MACTGGTLLVAHPSLAAVCVAGKPPVLKHKADLREGGIDTVPTRGRSLMAPALIGAAASGRPVIIVTDGEVDISLQGEDETVFLSYPRES